MQENNLSVRHSLFYTKMYTMYYKINSSESYKLPEEKKQSGNYELAE